MDEHYHDDSAGPGLGVILGVIAGVLVVLALLWFAWIGPTYYPTVITPVQTPAPQEPAQPAPVQPAPDINIQGGTGQGGTGGTGGTGGSVPATP